MQDDNETLMEANTVLKALAHERWKTTTKAQQNIQALKQALQNARGAPQETSPQIKMLESTVLDQQCEINQLKAQIAAMKGQPPNSD